jgi:hypothetical protein
LEIFVDSWWEDLREVKTGRRVVLGSAERN